MKKFLSGVVLTVTLCGLYATAQQPHVTTTLPSATVKLNGASGGSGTGFTWDAALDAWVFAPPSDTDATDIMTDNFSVLDSSENVLLGVASKIIAHIPLQVAGDTYLQLEEQELDASGAVVGSLVTCETTAGAVVATMTAGGAGDVGRFAIIRRSGANTCTVGVGAGQTLDGVTDGTTTVANGAWKTFVQTGAAAWATESAYPVTGTVSGLTATRIPVATAADAIGNSVITHNSTTGVTSVAGTAPSLTITDDNLTTTSTDALVLQNTTAATSGVTAQYSPRLRFVGSGWKTNATAAAQATEWLVEAVPFSRAVAPGNSLVFTPRRDGASSSTPLWMCQADTGGFVGLVVSGTTGRCDGSVGFAGVGYAGANNVGFWANAALNGNLSTGGFGQPSTGAYFFSSGALSTSGTTSGDTTLVRVSAGVLGARSTASVRGAILGARVVAAQASTPLTLVDPTDIDKVYTNEGASASITFNLPTAVAGLTYTFVVQDADGLSVVAAAGDTIRMNASVSAAAGNIASTTIGNTVTLVAINATEWVAIFYVGTVAGTWTVT